MSFQNYRRGAARKVHRCDECEQSIDIGTRYLNIAGINVDGDFSVWKAHEECDAANKELRSLNDLAWDEYATISEEIWDMDAPGLEWFRAAHPKVFARFERALIEHGRIEHGRIEPKSIGEPPIGSSERQRAEGNPATDEP